MRQHIKLNHQWAFKKTGEVPEVFPENWDLVKLPHTWNNLDGQDGGNDYFRGTGVYCRRLDDIHLDHKKVILSFEGVAMEADVYMNGKHVGHHEGGYSTFRIDLTGYLSEENWICVTADNSTNDYIYPQKADFTFYGGIYRDVSIILLEESHFEVITDGTPGVKDTPEVDGTKAEVLFEAACRGGSMVRICLDEKVIDVPVIDGLAKAVMTIQNVHLWQGIEDPFLYNATLKLFNGNQITDEITTSFGCRTIYFDSEQGFFLNGKSYPLRGVSRHQDREGVGSAISEAMQLEDMEIIKEIGANTIRLAHYQHSQFFYDLCDKEGMVVWAEIPYISHHMTNGRANTLSQMRELVVQNYNHPSIVCWGLSNEITASGSVSEDMMDNHRELNQLCHELDKTRPTTMAHVFMLETENPIIDIPDISSYNLYYGWYLGELEQNDAFFDDFHRQYPGKVIGFSEYGADANPQFQSEQPDRGDYSETYQATYHEHLLNCIEKRKYLWATHLWNMFDFAADGRDEGGKKGINQKGLVTFDRKIKKDVFYLYKAAWSKEPFVHLCGKRYVNRHVATTRIKVFSNANKVFFYKDGHLLEEKDGKYVFDFLIEIDGEHEISVTDGKNKDVMHIIKVEKPDEAYRISEGGGIINWFDQDDFNPEYYSIKDRMGDLMKHPETGKAIESLMAKLRSNRGDVAESTKGNKNLQKMMAQTPLINVLKQAGDVLKMEQVRELNASFQQVKKL